MFSQNVVSSSEKPAQYMVTQCVCFHKTFAELQGVMRHHELTTFEELKCHVRFGENCKRCVPYVKKMIETGNTAFEVFPETRCDERVSQ
jgi:bacterioferritin-associated ferredoxin